MKTDNRKLIGVLLAFSLLVGCNLASEGETTAWIDAPLDGAQIALDSEVSVHAHAYNPAGIAEMMLLVNGTAYLQGAPISPGSSFSEIDLTWQADTPGVFVLIVDAYDVAGGVIHSNPVTVTVGEGETEITDVPLVLPPTPTDTTTLKPSTPTDTSTPKPPTLTYTPYPPTWTTAPPDVTGPLISGVAHNPAEIWDNSNCGAASVTITAIVSDPSGVTSVKVRFRVVKGSTYGSWQEISMSLSGNSASAVLGPTQIMASLFPYDDSVVEYSLQAVDGKGNTSTSASYQFIVKLCFT